MPALLHLHRILGLPAAPLPLLLSPISSLGRFALATLQPLFRPNPVQRVYLIRACTNHHGYYCQSSYYRDIETPAPNVIKSPRYTDDLTYTARNTAALRNGGSFYSAGTSRRRNNGDFRRFRDGVFFIVLLGVR